MSLVCIFCGWACAACIVGLQAGSKNKNKVRPAVGNGSSDRLIFFVRLKSGLNDPELIEQKPSKTYGLMPQSPTLKKPQKNTKVRPAVDNGSWDRLNKILFVLKSGSTTPNPLNRIMEL